MALEDYLRDPRLPEELRAELRAELDAHRRAGRILEERERRLAIALESASVSWWHASESTWRFWRGWYTGDDCTSPPSQAPSFTLDEVVATMHPDDVEPVMHALHEHMAGRAPLFEAEYRVRDGERWAWRFCRGKVYGRDEHGRASDVFGMAVDITPRKEAEEARRESQRRLELAVESARLTWFQFEIATGALEWDRRWLHMHDPAPAPGTAEELYRLVHPGDLARVWEVVDEYLAGNSPRLEVEYRIRTRGGAWRWHSLRGQVCERDASGAPTRIAGVTMDITPRKEAELALARANADLEELAYAVSHDIREPLHSVAAKLVRVREEAPESPCASRLLEEAQGVVARLGRMLDDLLLCARLGRAAFEPAPVSLTECLSVALDNLDTALAESGAVIEGGGLPSVMGDRTQLTLLLQNLVANAAKFRGEAVPRITVAQEPWSQPDLVLIAVHDNGMGIEPWDLARVFGMFHRGRVDDTHPGTGMGLALCRKIVDRHGGRIWAESTLGQGTVIRFTLPAVSHEPPASRRPPD